MKYSSLILLKSTLIIAFLIIPAVACAQKISLPQHALTVRSNGNGCILELIPSQAYGVDPPKLFVETAGSVRPDVLQIKSSKLDGARGIQLVFDNTRTPFVGSVKTSAKSVIKSRAWQVLNGSFRRGVPFHLTKILADGSYASSRFENIDPRGVISILEAQCRFSSSAITAKSPAQRRSDERALGLSRDQLQHIRWVLHAKYRTTLSAPTEGAYISSLERLYIAKYSRSIGFPESKFLTSALADRLLREEFVAKRKSASGNLQYRPYRDWQFYVEGNRCHIVSNAKKWTGIKYYVAPQMYFSAVRNISGNELIFSMVRPNPFRKSSNIRAVVDGKRYVLQIDDDRVLPRRDGTGVSDDIMKAIRVGESVTIRGISKDAGELTTITFSAFGFTAAFLRMQDVCNRPALRDWFR